MHNATVAETDEVIHHGSDAPCVRRADHIERVRAHASSDDHRRQLLTERGQRLGRQLGPEQKKTFAAKVQQGFDDLRLAVRGGDGTKDHLVAGAIGGSHDILCDLGVEAVSDVDRDPDVV